MRLFQLKIKRLRVLIDTFADRPEVSCTQYFFGMFFTAGFGPCPEANPRSLSSPSAVVPRSL